MLPINWTTQKNQNLWLALLWLALLCPGLLFVCSGQLWSALVCTGNVRPWWLCCPSITVIHDLQYRRFPELWPWAALWHRRLFVPRSVRRSTAIVALSKTAAAEIEADFGRSDVTVCGQAVRIDHDQPDTAETVLVDSPYFLLPSSLAEHKNLANLCTALQRMSSAQALPTLVCIGAYRADEFPYQVPEGCVRILGHVSTAARDSLLPACDGVVLPSIYEGFGMPYAEALLAGKPVIACDLPVAREVLAENASFIPAPFGVDEIEASLVPWFAGERVEITPEAQAELRHRTDPLEVARRYLTLIRKIAEDLQDDPS